MRKIVVVGSAFFLGIILTLVFESGHRHSMYRERSSLDPALLQAAIRSSNMVRIYSKTQEVLFESQDADDILWLSEVFIADTSYPLVFQQSRSGMRYRLIFYDGSKIAAEIRLKPDVRFNWVDSAWGRNIDFCLDSKSYGEILPWLCEKSGKDLSELFPVKDWIKGIRERPPKVTEEEQSLYQDEKVPVLNIPR